MVQRKQLCLYINTSMLIRALEDPGAREFLGECCSRHQCVVSSVHWREEWRRNTLTKLAGLLMGLGIATVEVNVEVLEEEATSLIEERGWSPRRLVDLMHVLAAVELGCHGVIAVDRFMARRAKEYGLLYVNQYTGCPKDGQALP